MSASEACPADAMVDAMRVDDEDRIFGMTPSEFLRTENEGATGNWADEEVVHHFEVTASEACPDRVSALEACPNESVENALDIAREAVSSLSELPEKMELAMSMKELVWRSADIADAAAKQARLCPTTGARWSEVKRDACIVEMAVMSLSQAARTLVSASAAVTAASSVARVACDVLRQDLANAQNLDNFFASSEACLEAEQTEACPAASAAAGSEGAAAVVDHPKKKPAASCEACLCS